MIVPAGSSGDPAKGLGGNRHERCGVRAGGRSGCRRAGQTGDRERRRGRDLRCACAACEPVRGGVARGRHETRRSRRHGHARSLRSGGILPCHHCRGRRCHHGFDARHERRSSSHLCDCPAFRRRRRKRFRAGGGSRHHAGCKIVPARARVAVVGAKVGDGFRVLCPRAGRSGLLGDDLRHDRTAEGGRAPA